MLGQIKCFFRKELLKSKHKCNFSKDVYFNSDSRLEGFNSIKSGSRMISCKMGAHTYLSTNVHLEKTVIGRYTCIGPSVSNIMGNHPTKKFVSVHPSFFSVRPITGEHYIKTQKFDEHKYTKDGNACDIGNDVWIGANAVLFEGISIGDGAIIGANSVVTKDVPPYAIVVGSPAKILRYRFSADQIAALKKIEWWNKSEKWIQEHADSFDDIESFIQKFKEDK